MIRAAIYTRVSSDRQEQDGSSLETQLERCEFYSRERGYTIVARFSDTFTGAKWRERPGLTSMRELVHAGGVDVVVCYAVDRLSRNQAHLYIVAEEIDDHRARLEFVTEDFEDSAVGRFIRSARAFAAEVEREKTTERTTRGRRARVESGKLIPNGQPLYGYRWRDEDHTAMDVDPITSLVVRRIYDDCLSGLSLRKIVEGLYRDGIPSPAGRDSWSLTSVSRVLRHPNYTGNAYAWWGHAENGKHRYAVDHAIPLPEGTVPPLVTQTEWELVQQRLSRNKAFAARNNSDPEAALLRGGFVRCGYCGGAMVANVSSRRYPQYQCNYRSVRPSTEHRGVTISTALLDDTVWERVTRFLTDPAIVQEQLQLQHDGDDVRVALDGIEQAVAELDRRIENLVQSIELVDNPAPVIARLNRANEQRQQLVTDRDRLLKTAGRQEMSRTQLSDLRDWCRAAAVNLDRLDYNDRRELLFTLGLNVKVFGKDAPNRFLITAEVDLDAPIVLR